MFRKKTVISLVLGSIFLLYFLLSRFLAENLTPDRRDSARIVNANNYLAVTGKRQMLIDLPTCQIPLEVKVQGLLGEVNPVLPSVSFNSSDKHPHRNSSAKTDRERCEEIQPRFTFVSNGNILKQNLRLEFKSVSCCYRGIQRIYGSDNQTELTKDCIKIPTNAQGTVIESHDAILVNCDNYSENRSRMYLDYHAIIRNQNIKSKLNLNELINGENKIPSVLIIGLDSVSRYHFEELMPQTRHVLEKLGAVEMAGYSKVGLNTFPNVIPLLTGYSEDEILTFCYERYKPIDQCPFLWHNLTQAMSTAYMEDAPGLTAFNYYKFGFLKQPTEYYLRPLMLRAAEKHKYTFPCIGGRSTEAFVLDYIEQLHSLKSPIFSFTWLTSLAHEGFESLSEADRLFSSYFQKLDLTNTILVFMSDHGLRFGDSRRTFNGWFNSKLPFFTITLPKSVKVLLGSEKIQNLRENSKKLTTPFDAYHTLTDILAAYNLTPKVTENKGGVYVNGTYYPRTSGQSMFTRINENRTCLQAGIPKQFCPCSNLEPMSLTDSIIQIAAQNAVDIINGWLPSKCKPLKLDQITAAAKLNNDEFLVGFKTTPGESFYEAVSRFDGASPWRRDESEGETRRETITRTNKVDFKNSFCVHDWFLELYCYCDDSSVLTNFLENVFGK